MPASLSVLVTGANGFVGRALCEYLVKQGTDVVAATRRELVGKWRNVCITDIDGSTDWSQALHGVTAVVHLAGRAHIMNKHAGDPIGVYRQVNTDGTLNLARQAAAAGVRRFLFISSIKVNGEETAASRAEAFSEDSPPAHQDPYGLSKWEAEQGLRAIALETGMAVVILRPPLVYGPKVGANFLRLMRLVERGVPLPFGAVDNRRSLLYLGNLLSAITLCLEHPQAANQTYLLADGEDISTPAMVRELAAAIGRAPRLLPLPAGLLSALARVAGKAGEAQRLLGSLVVDSSKIRRELGWQPPFDLKQGLAETVRWYNTQ